MAWTDLTAQEQEDIKEFFRDFRGALGDTVRGFRMMAALVTIYGQNVQPHWATINAGDTIPDETGLANAGSMTKADWDPIIAWVNTGILNGIYDHSGGVTGYSFPSSESVDETGILAAGPGNV